MDPGMARSPVFVRYTDRSRGRLREEIIFQRSIDDTRPRITIIPTPIAEYSLRPVWTPIATRVANGKSRAIITTNVNHRSTGRGSFRIPPAGARLACSGGFSIWSAAMLDPFSLVLQFDQGLNLSACTANTRRGERTAAHSPRSARAMLPEAKARQPSQLLLVGPLVVRSVLGAAERSVITA
jgi:hypothetical protein